MTERLVTRSLTMPERVWGRLASIADERGTTIDEVIAAGIFEVVPDLVPPVRRPYPDGFTGYPGQRLEVLEAEVREAFAARRRRRAGAVA